jgi:hypothetical protein
MICYELIKPGGHVTARRWVIAGRSDAPVEPIHPAVCLRMGR